MLTRERSTVSTGKITSMLFLGEERLKSENRKNLAETIAQRLSGKTAVQRSNPSSNGGSKINSSKAPEPEKPTVKGKKDRAPSSQSYQSSLPEDAPPALENLVIIAEANAARFELHDIDNRVLMGFLRHKFNILMFNYTGYDSSHSAQASLDVSSTGDKTHFQTRPQRR